MSNRGRPIDQTRGPREAQDCSRRGQHRRQQTDHLARRRGGGPQNNMVSEEGSITPLPNATEVYINPILHSEYGTPESITSQPNRDYWSSTESQQ
ncbi:hypothetical protein SARC_05597 [Sphaeroforma arctica JP610]|uniref:Uncharacterized protein n=1 Tax=Sphaeroforma arctica JP610 TaxID=667725 RepID=A0A0L0G1Q5_9EUKA|nr:hypothetical protein SARC_05597 [Sphaeroforma arctica JP610]KNC82108.1 hypothetical protein SARC_05597 [Sphaeroforma arctica JP610]|eukprot:XP_014156010.1 hypothetical protein SARC_05597 [Sphaeroforma arctica JP610]